MSYLMHYGIKGQKWGVRRYQNRDGTYTELGKKRERDLRASYKVEKGLTDAEWSYYNGVAPSEKFPRTTKAELRKNYDNIKRDQDQHKSVVVYDPKGVEVSAVKWDYGNEWVMAWASAPMARRKGLTSKKIKEAMTLIESFEDEPLFTAYIDSTNTASIKTAEKNGFIDSNYDYDHGDYISKRYVYKGTKK